MTGDFKDFLEGQRSTGTFHSEGSFTLNLQKAWEKLGRFSLPEEEFFLLKVVQAAVAGGAAAIDISMKGHSGVLTFEAPLPPIRELLSWLSGSQVEVSRVHRHLATGLLCAPQDWKLRTEDVVLTRKEGTLELETAESISATCWEFSAIKSRMVLEDTLRYHARFSPIPIHWNGRSIGGHWEAPHSRTPDDWIQYLSPADASDAAFRLPGLPFAEFYREGDLFIWGRGPSRWSARGTLFSGGRPCWLTRFLPTPTLPIEGVSTLRLQRAIRFTPYNLLHLTYIIDGVALPTVAMNNSGRDGFEVLQEASSARTDLSGFQVIDDDQAAIVGRLWKETQWMEFDLLNSIGNIGRTHRGRRLPSDKEHHQSRIRYAMETLSAKPIEEPVGAGLFRLGHPLKAMDHGRYTLEGQSSSDAGRDGEEVYYGWDHKERRLVIVHRYQKDSLDDEIAELSRLKSTCVAPLLYTYSDPEYRSRKEARNHYLVVPLTLGRTLFDVVTGADLRDRVRACLGYLNLFEELHRLGLSPPGVVALIVTHQGKVTPRDGVLQFFNPSSEEQQKPWGRQRHLLAPEEAAEGRASSGSSYYRLGVLLYRSLVGDWPYPAKDDEEDLLLFLQRRVNEDFPDPSASKPDLSPALVQGILSLTTRNPEDRHLQDGLRELLNDIAGH